MPAAALTVSPEQIAQYHQKGFFILERALTDEMLESLRAECRRLMDEQDAKMDKAGTEVFGITHKSKRYFIGNGYRESQPLRDFLYSELMADICRATLGGDAYLFNEQYVVKCAEVGMKFAWHQDSGYIGHPHREYLSCWCALDDMSEANGTVYMLPHTRSGVRGCVEHVKESGTNDLVGYRGSDPGDPVIVPAGSIAVFSSVTFHRSGANATDKMRRVYLAQYSAEPIMAKDGSRLWNAAEPFLKNGQRV